MKVKCLVQLGLVARRAGPGLVPWSVNSKSSPPFWLSSLCPALRAADRKITVFRSDLPLTAYQLLFLESSFFIKCLRQRWLTCGCGKMGGTLGESRLGLSPDPCSFHGMFVLGERQWEVAPSVCRRGRGGTVESGRHLVVNEEPTAPGALLLASWSRSRDVYSPLN